MICTRKKSIIAALALPLIMFAVFCYHIPAWELDKNGRCNIKEGYKYLEGQVGVAV